MKDWMEKQIWSVVHIMAASGNILDLEEFNTKYNTDCSIESYRKVTQNIPSALIQSVKNSLLNITTPRLHKIQIDDVDLVNEKCNNTFLRQHFVNTVYPGRTRSTLILHGYDKSDRLTIRTKFLKFQIPPKYKEVHFRTINNIYPSNEFIRKRFKFEVENCHICNTNVETTEHVFYECETVQNLWSSLHNLLSSKLINVDPFSCKKYPVGCYSQT